MASKCLLWGVVMDIVVNDLVVKYGNFTAVNGISFEVEKGQILAVIGPERFGKNFHNRMYRRAAKNRFWVDKGSWHGPR